MQVSQSTEEQNHPLYLVDRDHVDRLLATDSPQEKDLIDLARLLIRYEEFEGANDIKTDMIKILKLWGLTLDTLKEKTRRIWDKGFRPGDSSDDSVGSGFDTSDSDDN